MPFLTSLLSKFSVSVILYIGLFFLIIGSYYYAYNCGKQEANAKIELEQALHEQELLKIQAASKDITIKTITEYVTVIKRIKEKGENTTEYVDRWLTPSDGQCIISNSFVKLHNAAAANEKVDNATDTNDSLVKLSQVGTTISNNYNICEQNAAQLRFLQDWIIKQKRIHDGK